MREIRGAALVLVVATCLHQSSALPDLFAPFRSMLGMKGSSSNAYPKPLSSSKDPISSQIQGFAQSHSPESEPEGGANPFGGGGGFGGFGFDGPSQSHGPSSGGYRSGPPGGRQYQSQAPFGSGGRGSSHFGGGLRQVSSRPSYGGQSRPVRQQSGSYRPGSFSPSPNFGPSGFGGGPSYSQGKGSQSHHHPQPNGPPSQYRGPGHDDSTPYKYQNGGGEEGPSGPSPSPFPVSSSPYSGRPSSSSGSGPFPGGPPSSSPFERGPRPGPSSGQGPSYPFSNSPSQTEESGPQGPGFSGFGSFPVEDEDDSPSSRPPRGPPSSSFFGGAGGPSDGPSDDGPGQGQGPRPFSSGPSSSPYDGPQGFSGNGDDSPPSGSPPSFFGGNGNYPEQYEEAPRGTRQPGSGPHIISGERGYSQPEDDGQDHFGYSGPGSQASPVRGISGQGQGPPSWSPPQGQSGQGQGPSPFGSEDAPSQSLSGSRPAYQPRKRRPSIKNFSRPGAGGQGLGGFQHQVSESRQPMMMEASSSTSKSTLPVPVPREGKGKRYSAKIGKIPMKPRSVVPLVSPKDPNYQPMASNSHMVSAPYEPATSATEHGHGGHEGLSHNGDRILYHVAGHQGPKSYRFGYDTGKGYNRLFRFEEKDGKGYVKGKYGFYDKHGKLQVIHYEAHPKHGFHAERAHAHH